MFDSILILMRLHKMYLISSTLALVAALLLGCGVEESNRIIGPPFGGRTQLDPVSNLLAYSAGETSVGLSWVPSTSEGLDDFNNYYVRAKLGADSIVSTAIADKGEAGVIVDSLHEGVLYTFEVLATANLSSTKYRNSVAKLIRWSPARRLELLPGDQPINVFETSDSNGLHSGLKFFDSVTEAPKVVSITDPGKDSLSIDIYVWTESNRRVSIRSASLLHPTWRHTKFTSAQPRFVSSLDDPRSSPPDSSLYTVTKILIDSTAKVSSAVYYFKTETGNYGRLLLLKNPDNATLLWGRSPAQYLSFEISYQTFPSNRYSKNVPISGPDF